MLENGKLIICPTEEKMRLLQSFQKEQTLQDIRFMTKEEYFQHYFFSYDEKAYFYLMKKYHWNLDVVKTYLRYLFVIDEKKEYSSSKLQFLKNLKKELMDENLLTFSPDFSSYLSSRTLEVVHYYDLDQFEEEALSYMVEVPDVSFSHPVYEFQTMEEEVNFVCLEILKLLKQGISPSKIFLTNVSENYFYTIQKLFSYYHIPINIPFQNSIYGTKVVSNYLKTKEIPFEDVSAREISKKLIAVLGSLSSLDLEDEVTKSILLDKLKHTNLSNKRLDRAVSIREIGREDFLSDEYVFLLGFNQDVFPVMRKDIEYITDSEKEEVSLYSTSYFNGREKKVAAYLLSQIPNLTLSYKLSTPFESFYPSSLITDLGLPVEKGSLDSYQYSHFYNQLRLGEMLDTYYLYGEKSEKLPLLSSSYTIPYRTYSNVYTGISSDLYLEHLPYPLKLSYTSLNSYNECKFQYYLKYVLKLDSYEDTFPSFIGSMYHKILSLYKRQTFDFEKEFSSYLEIRELSLKERMLLIRIKKDLLELIEVLGKQNLLTGYDEELYEKKVEVSLDKKVAVQFVGYIDKIMYYKKVEDTYFSIIDYKTGMIDTHIEPMRYGLHMQLPVYLYLIHYGKVFDNPIFTGIYYQNILFSYPTWSLKLEKERRERYYLQGYSTENVDVLSRFDSTYEDSTYIKSMKYSDEKGFGTYSKTLDDDTLYQLVQYTKKHIEEKTDEILEGDFSINPKVYGDENVSCRFCTFKDLCFMKEKDLIYLEKQKDLSFLGGEE